MTQEMTTISEAIERYFAARAAMRALPDDVASNLAPEWDVFDEARDALFAFPCSTLFDLQAKVAMILEDKCGLLDSLEAQPELLRKFLESVLCTPAADPALYLCSRWRGLWENCITEDEDPEGNERWSNEIAGVERQIAETKPTTSKGAAAMLDVLSRAGGASRHNVAIMANVTEFISKLDRAA